MSGEAENFVSGVENDLLGDEHTIIKSITPQITQQDVITSVNNSTEPPTLEYELSSTQVSLPKGTPSRIILQSTNGPCALIALTNALMLNGTLVLTGNTNVARNEHLLEALGSTLINLYYDRKATLQIKEELEEHEIIDRITTCLQKMQFGMCIDPRFGDPFSFSPFKESLLFELAGVQLCHAMIVEGKEYKELLGEKFDRMRKTSYDEAMQIACTDDTEEGALMKLFIEDNPDQLTIPGLISLTQKLTPNVPFIFLHNSHYSVIIKMNDTLLALVTDQGLVREGCSWSTIGVNGQEIAFLDSKFRVITGESAMRNAEYSKKSSSRKTRWCNVQ